VLREKHCGQKQINMKSLDIDVVCAGEVYWKIYVESNKDFYGNKRWSFCSEIP